MMSSEKANFRFTDSIEKMFPFKENELRYGNVRFESDFLVDDVTQFPFFRDFFFVNRFSVLQIRFEKYFK